MRRVMIQLSESTHEALKREAQRQGVPIAQYVREMVIGHLARIEAVAEERRRIERGDADPP